MTDIMFEFLNKNDCDISTLILYCKNTFSSKFNINNKEEYDEFIKLYKKSFEDKPKLSILEKDLEYGPLIFDFDLESSDKGNRLYDYTLIETLNKFIYKAIDKFLEINPEEIKLYLFEKPHSTVKDNMTQDGFYIKLPSTRVSIKMRHLICDELVKLCNEANIFDRYTKAVVISSTWFLYETEKPLFESEESTVQLYNLSKIYNIEGLYCDQCVLFSNRKEWYNKDNETNIRDEYINFAFRLECDSLGIVDSKQFEIPFYMEDQIIRADGYVKLLNSDRVYEYQDWLKVGSFLKSINNCLLVSWREFSKKSKNYNEDECEEIWRNIKTPPDGNILSLRSLAFWAKQDSPKEFINFLNNDKLFRI